MRNAEQSGVVLIAVVIILLPVIVTVGAFSSSMTSRTSRLVDEVVQEKALMAAESGIDLAIWAGQIGKLQDGVEFSYDLGSDTSCQVSPTHLLYDGRDNDGDGMTDERDEDVFQIVVRGAYRDTNRTIACYLGPVPRPPLTLPGAVTVMNPDVEIDMRGTPYFIGYDTNLDGTAGDPANDAAGLAITTPGTIPDLEGELDAGEATQVIGAGGTPSLATTAPPDIDAIMTFVQNSARAVLTNRRYASYDFDSPGRPTIAYREGDVAFSGNVTGSGILVINGDLVVTGNFRFDGIVVVMGDVRMGAGTAQIFGGLVQGPHGEFLGNRGTLDVRYSTQGIGLANSVAGCYVAFNGWQELAR